MLITLLVLSMATVLAILITLSRIVSLRTITKYGAFVDITVSIGLMFILAGTAVGAASAIVAGLFLAITLTLLKWWFKLVDKMTEVMVKGIKLDWPIKEHKAWRNHGVKIEPTFN